MYAARGTLVHEPPYEQDALSKPHQTAPLMKSSVLAPPNALVSAHTACVVAEWMRERVCFRVGQRRTELSVLHPVVGEVRGAPRGEADDGDAAGQKRLRREGQEAHRPRSRPLGGDAVHEQLVTRQGDPAAKTSQLFTCMRPTRTPPGLRQT